MAGAIGEDSNTETSAPRSLQEIAHLSPARHVTDYEQLNEIEEGSYGWVSRARQRRTGDIVALKKLKMGEGQARGGVPVTGLREIECLMASRDCAGIVRLREVVVGDALGDIYLVMDFIEHDLRTLQEDMLEPFLPSEVKALMLQLLRGVEFLHDHWILHRDLKTSNLLLNNRGGLKIADFGMARFYGNPAPPMTQLVVTLWYRSPELLLGASRYGSEVDTWSIGCIMAELLNKKPLMAGKNEVEQLAQVNGLPTTFAQSAFTNIFLADLQARRNPHRHRLARLPPTPECQVASLASRPATYSLPPNSLSIHHLSRRRFARCATFSQPIKETEDIRSAAAFVLLRGSVS